MISIIIRTKNEERWITRCLKQIQNQTIQDYEIILVDNNSKDKTVEKALNIDPKIKLIKISDYLPGKALNEGIRNSSGEFIVCLSAHCIPVHENWLKNLLNNLDDQQVAGVYGRQVPVQSTLPIDKRDLLITFGLDKKIQKRDPLFHNANSIIRRSIWEQIPFDEKVTNIEDRVWGKKVIDLGYILIYEPEAEVYHYHGIHQNNDFIRYKGVVRILDSLEIETQKEKSLSCVSDNLKIYSIIPLRGYKKKNNIDKNEELVLKTVNAALNSKYIDKVIISTDCEEIAKRAESWGAETPFLRPKELSAQDVRVDEVLKYSIIELEKQNYYPDLVVPLEVTYPFRPEGLIDKLIEEHIVKGLDTIISGFAEYRPCWIKEGNTLKRVDDFLHLRDKRMPLLIGIPGLGCVTYPEYLRKGTRLGEILGIHEISDVKSITEVR